MTPVETIIQTVIKDKGLGELSEDEFVHVFFEVIAEGERRDLLASGCDTHQYPPQDKLDPEIVDAWERGEDPCQPVVWVLKP